MALIGFPVDSDAELRGVVPASEFRDKATNDLIEVPAKAQLEFEMPDGSMTVVEVSSRQFEKAIGTFSFGTAKRGDRFRLVGVVREGERGSYLTLVSADVVGDVLAKPPIPAKAA